MPLLFPQLHNQQLRHIKMNFYNFPDDLFNNIIYINCYLEPFEVLQVLFTCMKFHRRYDMEMLKPSFETCLLPKLKSFEFTSVENLKYFMSLFNVSRGLDDNNCDQFDSTLQPCLSGSLPLTVLSKKHYIANDMDIFIFDAWRCPTSTLHMRERFHESFMNALQWLRMTEDDCKDQFQSLFLGDVPKGSYPNSYANLVINLENENKIQLIFVQLSPITHVSMFDITCCCNYFTASGKLQVKYPGHLQTSKLQVQRISIDNVLVMDLNMFQKTLMLFEQIQGTYIYTHFKSSYC
jgi:hypothetical protein